MALPLSGPISASMIRTELGIPSQAPFSIDSAENGTYIALNTCSAYLPSPSNPAAISEWYGYCHSCVCGYSFCLGYSTVSCAEACTDGYNLC